MLSSTPPEAPTCTSENGRLSQRRMHLERLERGTDVEWPQGIEISADTLWRLAGIRRARP
jgi:hypothetical protein